MPKHVKDFARVASLLDSDLLYAVRVSDELLMDKSVEVGALLARVIPNAQDVELPETAATTEVSIAKSNGSVFVRLLGGAVGQGQVLRFLDLDVAEGTPVLVENGSLSAATINSVLLVNEAVLLAPGDTMLGVRTASGLTMYRLERESVRAAREASVEARLDALDDYVEAHTDYAIPDGWVTSGTLLTQSITIPSAGVWLLHGHVLARGNSGGASPNTYVALQCFWGNSDTPELEDFALSGYNSSTDIVHANHVSVEMPVRRIDAPAPVTLTLRHAATFSGGPVARFVRLFAHKISA